MIIKILEHAYLVPAISFVVVGLLFTKRTRRPVAAALTVCYLLLALACLPKIHSNPPFYRLNQKALVISLAKQSVPALIVVAPLTVVTVCVLASLDRKKRDARRVKSSSNKKKVPGAKNETKG